MERTLDFAATELGIDRFELRKRNFIRKSEMPFKAASGMTYDCGDFLGVFKEALEDADSQRLQAAQARKQEGRQAARLRRRLLSRSHRCARKRAGRDPFRRRRHRHHRHRHARLRPGPRYGLRAGADRETRRSVRPHPPRARRQRPMAFGGGTGGSRSAMFGGAALTESSAT